MSEPYYSDDHVTIYHGEALATLAGLEPASCDVLLTDPPYSSGGMFRSDRNVAAGTKYQQASKDSSGKFVAKKSADDYGTFSGDSRDQRSWAAWVSAWSWVSAQVVRPGGYGFVFSDWRQLPTATDALQLGGWLWRGILAWDKGDGAGLPARGFFRPNVEFIAWATNGPMVDKAEVDDFPGSVITAQVRSTSDGPKEHPTQKPTQLLKHLFSVVPGDAPLTALDPFMGSGSTLVAAKYAGHKAIGIEIEERYCEIAAQRCAQEVLAL